MTESRDDDTIRGEVAATYTRALRRAQQRRGGCCGRTTTTTPAGVAAGLAGYAGDLDEVPADAAGASFGCGNPLAFAGVRPGDNVVDLGSGAGLDLILAARAVGPEGRVIGVDMTEAMIAAARRNVATAGLTNVEVREGVIERLPVDDASVDFVISNCVINLSPDKPAVFREIARVLRPGGRFSISDIVAEELPRDLRESAAAYGACIGGAIDERAYAAGLTAAGLEDIEVRDRIVYDAATLHALLAGELDGLGLEPGEIDEKIARVAGKVQSVRFIGRRGAARADGAHHSPTPHRDLAP